MKKPNFFIMGAPKCGTSSLYRYLSGHPQAFLSTPKEPHHFNTDSANRYFVDRGAYEELFRDVPESALAVGEASVRYLWSTDAARNIIEYEPQARFIVLVRNPVEMAPSVHQQELFNLNENVQDFEKAWVLNDVRWRGEQVPRHCVDQRMLHYGFVCSNGAHLQRLFATVGTQQVLVIVMDDLRSNPGAEFARVLEFLDLPAWAPPTFEVANAAKARRSRILRWAVLEAARIKRSLGMTASLGVLKSMNKWNVRPKSRQPLDSGMHDRLMGYFEQDIALLERLLDRDFSHWRIE